MASMYAYIVRGGSKSECPYVTDEESGATFDAIANEIEQMRKDGTAMFEIPGEIPGPPPAAVPGEPVEAPSVPPVEPEEPPADAEDPDDNDEPEGEE